jgi:hypothetical protein
MFNSALILGIIAVRRPNAPQTAAILDDLQEYCERLREDAWLNEFGLAEVKVVELCIVRTKEFAKGSDLSGDNEHALPVDIMSGIMDRANFREEDSQKLNSETELTSDPHALGPSSTNVPEYSPDMMWPAIWEDQNFAFPQATDLETWEQMISEIAYHD